MFGTPLVAYRAGFQAQVFKLALVVETDMGGEALPNDLRGSVV